MLKSSSIGIIESVPIKDNKRKKSATFKRPIEIKFLDVSVLLRSLIREKTKMPIKEIKLISKPTEKKLDPLVIKVIKTIVIKN